jgi:hypothetical protein
VLRGVGGSSGLNKAAAPYFERGTEELLKTRNQWLTALISLGTQVTMPTWINNHLFLHQGAPQPKFPKLKAFKATMMKI